MAHIFSKTLNRDDMMQMTIIGETFPAAERDGVMKVRDQQDLLWTFEYKVRLGNKRVISGSHWLQFLGNNGVQPGHRVTIYPKDSSCIGADYKIVVDKTRV